jgi:F0F1-type ATP synthase delta subunit
MKLNKNQLENISETLKDFKSLIPRYIEVKNDDNLLKKFCVRNRNPVWDLTSAKYFDTGLISEASKKQPKKNLVSDHYIQRSRATKFIFDELVSNPNITTEEFVKLIKKYCSIVKLTKEEHDMVTTFANKNKEYLNYEIYVACGIKIVGLSDIMLS